MSTKIEYKKEKSDSLSVEAIYLFNYLFNIPPPQSVIDNYIKAHRDCADKWNITLEKQQIVDRIVLNNLDPIAIEFFLRSKPQRHPLTSKLLLLSYLAEIEDIALKKNNSFFETYKGYFFSLFKSIVISGWLKAKGCYLVKKYSLK